MKFTAIFILIACLHVHAKGFSQQVTLSEKNAPLQKVLKGIEAQTGYVFFYEKALLRNAKAVTIQVKNAKLEEVLDLCFSNQPLIYSIVGTTIVIKPKPSTTAVFQPADNTPVITPPPLDITGKVTDAEGNPLIGASVRVKNSNKGTTTDGNGVFSLKGVDENATLEISFVGFETYTVAVNNKTAIVASLKLKPESLNEVIINKGYYTEKQKYSVGNVGKISSKDIENQPVQNPLLALQGRVPGLVITQNTGMPGGGVTVRIQGQNSISNGNNPLYVIDGVPFVGTLLSTGIDGIFGSDGAGGNGSPLSYVSPTDIESIEVLKDADATSIYGSRAANGAILITTKKGKVGRTKFDFNVQQGWGKVTRKIDMMNTSQYLQMRREAFINDGRTPGSGDYDLNGTWDTTRYTDWQKVLIGNTAGYTNVNGSFSGGTSLLQYFLGANFHRATTVFPFPSDFANKKGSVHLNLSGTSTNQKFRLELSSIYLIDNNQLPQNDITASAVQLEPVAPALYNDDGTLNWAPNSSGTSTWNNPLLYIYSRYKNKTSNFSNNGVFSYNVLPGLQIRSSLGYSKIETSDFFARPLISIRPESRASSQRGAGYGRRNLNSWIIEPQIEYNKLLGKDKLSALIGTTILQNDNNGGSLIARGFNNDAVLENISASTQVSPGLSFLTQYKYTALFGRINYNLKEKYIFNITARRDGSSRFGKKSQFHNFGSVGSAWIFSKEDFMRAPSFLSFGKLRASYGTTGSDQVGDYRFMNLYGTPNFGGGVAYQNIPSLYPQGLPNPYLEWEETRKLQAGIDLGFLKDKILINATYALNRSSNQLLAYALPSITGYTDITQNFPATVENTSWELTIQTTNSKSKFFTWNSNFNLTIPRNKLVEFPDLATSTYASTLIVGQPLDTRKVVRYLEVDPATGQYNFTDKNGNPTFDPSAPDDYNVLINTSPKFYGGFQNQIEYKGFKFDVLFQFVKQTGNILMFTNGVLPPGSFARGSSNQPVGYLDRWQKPGDNALIRKYTVDRFVNDYSYAVSSDAMYGDASYIRLKNISVSWELPTSWKRKVKLQNCRIYINGQNLWTMTNYQGLDPENQSVNSLPPLRVLIFGIQVGL